jgi:hypothetical protein
MGRQSIGFFMKTPSTPRRRFDACLAANSRDKDARQRHIRLAWRAFGEAHKLADCPAADEERAKNHYANDRFDDTLGCSCCLTHHSSLSPALSGERR